MTAVLPSNSKPKNVVWLAFTHESGEYVYVGLSNRAVTAYLRPHAKGIHLQINHHSKFSYAHAAVADLSIFFSDEKNKPLPKPQSYILPGEYTLREVSAFVAEKTGHNGWFVNGSIPIKGKQKRLLKAKILREREIAKALKESGIWKKRGKLNWEDCPKKFFKIFSLKNFMKGNTYSYRQWWIQYLAQHSSYSFGSSNFTEGKDYEDFEALKEKYALKALTIEDKIKKRAYQNARIFDQKRWVVKRKIANKVLPEIPSAIKGWSNLRDYTLLSFMYSGYIHKKRWPMFIFNVYPYFYKSIIEPHYYLRENFDEMTEYFNACPKSNNFVEALNAFINAGARFNDVMKLQFKTVAELKRGTFFMAEVAKRRNSKHILNKLYNPPEIELAEGWEWATHETFSGLSNKYACCISNAGSYERAIVEGKAHVLFRTDHHDEKGALAFIKHGKSYRTRQEDVPAEWHIQEIRSHSNGQVENKFNNYAQSIVEQMNKLIPLGSPVVPQINDADEFKKDLLNDPVGLRIAQLYPALYPEAQIREEVLEFIELVPA